MSNGMYNLKKTGKAVLHNAEQRISVTAFSAVYEAYIHTVYPFMAQRKADFVRQYDWKS